MLDLLFSIAKWPVSVKHYSEIFIFVESASITVSLAYKTINILTNLNIMLSNSWVEQLNSCKSLSERKIEKMREYLPPGRRAIEIFWICTIYNNKLFSFSYIVLLHLRTNHFYHLSVSCAIIQPSAHYQKAIFRSTNAQKRDFFRYLIRSKKKLKIIVNSRKSFLNPTLYSFIRSLQIV